MISSMLDTDLYKLTMDMAICQKYPKVFNHYKFINRDKREFPDGFAEQLRKLVDGFRTMKLSNDEKDFLRERCYYLNPVYLDFLAGYQFDPSEVKIEQKGPDLSVDIIGPAYRTVLWEVPLMSTISELYYRMTCKEIKNDIYSIEKREQNNRDKAEKLANMNIYYSEFGSRRRFAYHVQNETIAHLKKYGNGHMLGTSNIHFAMLHNLIPMGTVAHEWYMLHAALYGFKMANDMANEAWVEVFNGDLGTALPDTFTTDVFLKSFNTKYAKLYDGMRQDSGQPLIFLDKAIAHYQKLRINPLSKMLMFSDNLHSMDQINVIHEACKDKAIDRYGIGTWFTNDVGVKPLNIVIKLIACNFGNEWIDTIKLSDDAKKYTGNIKTVNLCKQTLGIM